MLDLCPDCGRVCEWELIAERTGQCSRCGCIVRDGVRVRFPWEGTGPAVALDRTAAEALHTVAPGSVAESAA